jgi:hypothetical protein
MFMAFQRGELPLFHLNFDTIIVLPKKENANEIQQYQPICPLNVTFKVSLRSVLIESKKLRIWL